MIYAAIYTEGEMNAFELRSECTKNNWLPLMVMRPKGERSTPPTLLTFTSEDVCDRFCKRNILKNLRSGWVALDSFFLNMLSSYNWNFKNFNYPNKLNFSEVELMLEVVYFPADRNYEAYIPY